MMKRKWTTVVWAGAWLTLASVSVPATGQEKPVMKTGVAVENVPNRDVQLRAGTPVDSAITFLASGERRWKEVYRYDAGGRADVESNPEPRLNV